MNRLKEQYQNEIVSALMKKFGYKNIMQVPKLDKIVVNMGVGEARENAKILEAAAKDYRPEAHYYKGKAFHCQFQIKGRHGNRLQGYFKGRKDV